MSEELTTIVGLRTLELEHFTLSATGLRVKGKPTLEQWQALGETLATLERGVAWIVGDWMNSGEQLYGELAAQAIDQESWTPETARVYRWVASKVPPENRRSELSFNHHQLIAGLAPLEQRQWLDKAAGEAGTEPWPAARLKNELAASSSASVLKMEYLCTVAFDQPAARDILAQEYERVGRPVFRSERTKREKKVEEL